MAYVKDFIIKGSKPAFSHKQIPSINLIGVEYEGGWTYDNKPARIITDTSVKVKVGVRRHNCHKHTFCHIADNCQKCWDGDCLETPCKPTRSGIFECVRRGDHCPNAAGACKKVCECDVEDNNPIEFSGETVSPALTYEELIPWAMNNHPDEVDESCGLHVHVSFHKVNDYIRLMTPEFYEFFLKWLEDWGHKMEFPPHHDFWKRLRGENKYCHKLWADKECQHNHGEGHPLHPTRHDPEDQAACANWNPHRYAQLNFCFLKHGTLECRVFPAFKDPRMSLAAVECIVTCYQTYLSQNKAKQEPIKITQSTKYEDSIVEEPVKTGRIKLGVGRVAPWEQVIRNAAGQPLGFIQQAAVPEPEPIRFIEIAADDEDEDLFDNDDDNDDEEG